MDDHVLLKNIVIRKGGGSGIENMDAPDAHCPEEELPEGSEVRPVAEAAGGNGYKFPSRVQQLNGQCQEPSIEVGCLDANSAKQ
jgi:hypothetical protein